MITARSPSFLSLRRFGVPVLILLFAFMGTMALWLLPDLAPDRRSGNTFFLGVAAIGLLTFWIVALSGFRWYYRIGVLLIEIGAVATLYPYLVFDGDMVPHLRPPWERHDDLVEQNRREHEADPAPAVELSDRPTDWPEFRGRHRDGVVVGPPISRDWNAKPPRLVWKQPCGEGFGSFALSGTLAVTLEQRRQDYEAVVAYDARTGREVWKYEYPARFYEPLGGLGPRSTPTISDGEVFSLGATGLLVCLDAKTGAHKWTVNILEGRRNLAWGMAGSPLVVDNRVIVFPGTDGEPPIKDRALIAYDRNSHEVAWSGSGQKAGYSSPMLATLAGFRLVIVFGGKDIAGFNAETGERYWGFDWSKTQQDINVAQPLILDGDRIFITSGYGTGCAMLQVKEKNGAWSCEAIWQRENQPLRCKLSSCVERNGFIYGLDEGFLACIDAKDGHKQWRDGRYGHGQLLRQGDLLIILDERGNLVLVEATPNGHHELGKVKAISSERTWNVPAMVDGRIFVRNDREMACFDLRE
jgi:outer membrane protein assembly factor BamB